MEISRFGDIPSIGKNYRFKKEKLVWRINGILDKKKKIAGEKIYNLILPSYIWGIYWWFYREGCYKGNRYILEIKVGGIKVFYLDWHRVIIYDKLEDTGAKWNGKHELHHNKICTLLNVVDFY